MEQGDVYEGTCNRSEGHVKIVGDMYFGAAHCLCAAPPRTSPMKP